MRWALPLSALYLSACGSIGLDLDGPFGDEGAGAGAANSVKDPDGSGGAPDASGGAGTGGDSSSGGSMPTGGASTGGTAFGGANGSGGSLLGSGVLVHDSLNGPFLPGVENETEGTLTFVEKPTLDGSPVLQAIQGEQDTVVVTHEFDLPNNIDLYFRAWLYVPHGAVNGGMKLVGLHSDGEFGTDVNLHLEGRTQIFSHSADEGTNSEDGAFPVDEWFCFRVHYRIAEQGSVEVFVGDNSTVRVEGVDTAGDGLGVSALDYGMPYTNDGQKDGVIYWDEVVFATHPVACD